MNAPRYLSLALTPHERRMLWGAGTFQFREGSAPVSIGGSNRRRKPGARYGFQRRVAQDYALGRYPNERCCDVARRLGLREESLRSAICTERRKLKLQAKGRAA